jgi:hypothetical protein
MTWQRQEGASRRDDDRDYDFDPTEPQVLVVAMDSMPARLHGLRRRRRRRRD